MATLLGAPSQRESAEIATIPCTGRTLAASSLLRQLDLPGQLAQLRNSRAHLGVMTGGAAASTVRLDRSEPFLED